VIDLTSGTAVVTGGGSGIGRALAMRAAMNGMHVVVADVEGPAAAAVAAEVGAAGGSATPAVCDVSDGAAVEALASTVFAAQGGVRLLCLNAGVFQGGLLWERTVEDFAWTLGVNTWGPIHGVRSFVPRMLAAGAPAHVVVTASMGGLVTNAFSGPYYTSKFAAVGLTECLAHDLAAVGAPIGVSVLVPSLVATRIGWSDRNRPEPLRSRPALEDPPPDVAFVDDAIRTSTTDVGMDPDEVAGLVLAAVARGDFYIPTKPSYDRQLTGRHEDMLARRLPRSPDLD
jgi:NAD(P)-dependent dehydrogenase (short-subunit alcohol dehydrogenase family)